MLGDTRRMLIDELVAKYRTKPTKVLERYYEVLRPKGSFDLLKYLFSDRYFKGSAVGIVLGERKARVLRNQPSLLEYKLQS